jgi:hypothetical protein
MPGHEFFERLLPRFALQSGAAKKTADRQADAERLIARAEYECVQMRRELMAAFAVPLSHRAVQIAESEPAAPEPATADATPTVGAAKAA